MEVSGTVPEAEEAAVSDPVYRTELVMFGGPSKLAVDCAPVGAVEWRTVDAAC